MKNTDRSKKRDPRPGELYECDEPGGLCYEPHYGNSHYFECENCGGNGCDDCYSRIVDPCQECGELLEFRDSHHCCGEFTCSDCRRAHADDSVDSWIECKKEDRAYA